MVPICQWSEFAVAALLSVAPQADVAERAVDTESGHTYVRTQEPLTFFDAEALARAMGGTLASIASAQEETFLLENFGASEGYWIGLEFPRERWSTGEAAAFTHWFTGKPSGGASEPFTLLNWGEPGAWGDSSGDVETERYRALLEFEKGQAPGPRSSPPIVRHDNRGVLLCAIQGLTSKNLENAKLVSLNELWKRSAWTFDAAADASGDPLAGLGMLAWGVGSGKSRLSSAGAEKEGQKNAAQKGANQQSNQNLLTRLERTHPNVTTACLLDDPALSGILMDGRLDLRVSNASPRKGGSLAPVQDAMARATPLCIVAAWTNLAAQTASDAEHARELAAIDEELGALLAALRARPAYSSEDWWIALAGIAPTRTRPEKLDGPRAQTAVPLCLVSGARSPCELFGEIGLVDLVPSALEHLGIEARRCWGLDGHALALDRAPTFGQNLIVNGDAEAQFGYAQPEPALVTGWRQLGGFRLGRHDPVPVLAGDPGPAVRGQSYLQGGNEARLEQTVDLNELAADIDRGAVRFELAAWLGFQKASRASLELALEFLNERKKPSERVVLTLPAPAREDEGLRAAGLTKLGSRGRIPRRTRAARLVLSVTGAEEAAQTIADEIRLVLVRD